MNVAKVRVKDIKDEKGIYLISVEVHAEGYDFFLPYKIEPLNGVVDVKSFKENIKSDILKEVKHRKAIEPIRELGDKEFNIEYGSDKKDNPGENS